MKRIIVMACASAAAAGAATLPLGAEQSQPAATTDPATPSLADIMTGIQLRHLKLAYSGRVKNWPLAGYELDLIQQSLDTAVEQLHVALLAYQTLFSDGCRRFGATKDTVECAFMPLIEALRLESYVYDVKWCAEGLTLPLRFECAQLWFANFVMAKIESRFFVIALDWKHFLKNGLKTGGFPF